MEALKLKIFDVLTEKIAVSEFENWLYNSEEFMNQINSNSFYFDVISINYKTTSWHKNLNHLVEENYDEDFIVLYEIEKTCLDLMEPVRPEETYQILSKILINFDYNTEYNILWEFYSNKDRYELFKEGFFKKNNINEETKFYAAQVLSLIKNCNSLEEKKRELTKKLKPYKIERIDEKTSLTKRIFAFLRKI